MVKDLKGKARGTSWKSCKKRGYVRVRWRVRVRVGRVRGRVRGVGRVRKKEWRKEIGGRNRARGEGGGGDSLGKLEEEEGRGQWWAGHQLSCKVLGV